MATHYLRLNFNKKISIVQSMFVMSKKFLDSYDYDLSYFDSDEELLNDLYFYWLRMSAIKQYVWCKEYDEFFLSSEFAEEMKFKLKSILFRVLILKRELNQDKKELKNPSLTSY